MTTDVLGKAAEFLWQHARLLERRLLDVRLGEGAPTSVVAALRPYQNADGGFGQALEPDIRAPTSQPVCVELALQALREAGAPADATVRGACDYLESVCGEGGAVAPGHVSLRDFPRAKHWDWDWALEPALNPTAGIAGHLHALGAEHAWLDRATEWCLEQIPAEPIVSAHTLRCVFGLLESLPDRERATELLEIVRPQLFEAEWFTLDVPVTTYTLTPLHFAPAPGGFASSFFDYVVIEAHLDDLLARQQDDGGWPIHWEAPAGAATAEWRGRWTLDALLTLRAYGRI